MTEEELQAIRDEIKVSQMFNGAQRQHLAEDVLPRVLAEVERLQAVIDETQEYIVLHAFDTTVGRKIDDFITERLKVHGERL